MNARGWTRNPRVRTALVCAAAAGGAALAAGWAFDPWRAAWAAAGAALAAGAAGGWIAHRTAATARALAERAAGHGARAEGGRLPEYGAGPDLDRLARAYNSLAARLEATLAETQRFTSDASHELRTPLTALRAMGEVALRREDDPAAWRAALGDMLEQTARMNRLVDQLLLLARSDADALPAQIGEVDAGELLGEVAEALRALAEERGLRLAVECPAGLRLRGDAEWLRVALMNLVQNAVRHSPDGGAVTLSAMPRGYDVVVEVADEGPGVAAEHHERIFERFYRVDKARARAEGGVGLGLAIAKWAVERSGGVIGLRSEPGRGAAFWMRLPGAAAESGAGANGAAGENGEGAARSGAAVAAGPADAELREAARRPLAEVCARLGTDGRGLTWRVARERLAEVGPNHAGGAATPSMARLLAGAALTPFNGILAVLAAVALVTGDHAAAVVMGLIFVIGTTLRARQERRSWTRVGELPGAGGAKVAVLRGADDAPADREPHSLEPEFSRVATETLVPGDVVRLTAGERVPSDVRVLEARDFFVLQSPLTGEAMPVEKFAATAGDGGRGDGLFELPNLVLTGSTVVAGEARALVVATGPRAYLGAMAEGLAGPRGPTAFDAGVNRVSWLLVRFMAVMLPVAFVLNGLWRGEWGGTFFFALAVAVGLIPEMLPLVVNANLARGAAALAKRRAPAKRIAALHDLGAMDILCTDKTGTLTRDEVEMLRCVGPDGGDSGHTLDLAYLNAVFQTGIKNLPDRALVAAAREAGLRKSARDFVKVDELPFDPLRRRVTVVLRDEEGGLLAVCKGAAAEVVEVCDRVNKRGMFSPLDAEARARVIALVGRLEDEGLRVLAVASRELRPEEGGARAEREMALAGLVAFRDPPKAGAAEALRRLGALGVGVKVLTGDSPQAARALARELGLAADGAALDGAEMDGLDDAELAARAEAAAVCARLTPAQKARIVRALRARGRAVGFLGDGVNDAPALRAADVGLAPAEGAEVAREAADVVLLEKDLGLLAEAVEVGRRTHGNIAKYLKAAASANFGNALAVLGSVAFLPFLPMLPLQLLVQNLLYGATQLSIPWDRVDREYLARPRPWDARGVGRFMLVFGPLSTAFDGAAFAFLWWAAGLAAGGGAATFQGGWFVFGLLSQTLALHVIRTQRSPFWRRPAATPVLVTTALAMAVGAWLPFSPWAGGLGLEAPPAAFWWFLPVALVVYAAALEGVKRVFLRRLGAWL